MKRIISLFLAILLCILNIDPNGLYSYADKINEFKIVYVCVNVNGNTKRLPAIQNENKKLFFSGKTLSEITVYNNQSDEMFFQHDKATELSKYREIVIYSELKGANVITYSQYLPNIVKSVELADVISYNNEWYFPIAEMLPLLNAHAVVENNCLYVENIEYSLSNIMPEFEINDYMFNMYHDNDILGFSHSQILVGWSYLYNTVMEQDLNRVLILPHNEEAYEDIFKSFLIEDDVFLETISKDEQYSLPLVDYLMSDEIEPLKRIKETYDIAYEEIEIEHQEMLKKYPTIDSYTNEYTNSKLLLDFFNGAEWAMKIYSFSAIYADHVEDHYQMLNSIYRFDYFDRNNLGADFSAASNVYRMFSNETNKAVLQFVMNESIDYAIDNLSDLIVTPYIGPNIVTAITKYYFSTYGAYIDVVASNCENLGRYNKLMERGLNKYKEYDINISKDNIENKRLSAIFTLLSSRSIYQALCNSDQSIGNNGVIYQKKVDSINEILKKFYLAKNCCLTDSEEYIDERIEMLNSTIDTVAFIDENSIEQYEWQLSAKVYNRTGGILYSEERTDSTSICVIPDEEEVTIISFPEKYLAGESSLIKVEYNWQVGYINTNDIIFDATIDLNELSNSEACEIGTLLYNQYLQLCKDFSFNGGIRHARFSNDSDAFDFEYIRLEPAELSLEQLKMDYQRYFSSQSKLNLLDIYIERNGYLWKKRVVYGEEWKDKTMVTNIKRISSKEIIFTIDTFRTYNEGDSMTYKTDFKIAFEEGFWKYVECLPSDANDMNNSNMISKNEVGDLSTIELNLEAKVIGKDGVILRKNDSEESKQLDNIPYGTTIKIISLNSNYKCYGTTDESMVKVEYKGQYGYVPSYSLLVDNAVDISRYSPEQVFAYCTLNHNQMIELYLAFERSGGLFNCTFADEYDENYNKLLPAGLKKEQLISDFNMYFSFNGWNDLRERLNELYKEKNGFLWVATGYGGFVDWQYDEVTEVISISDNKIKYKNVHYIIPEYYEAVGYKQREEYYELNLIDGRWKYSDCSTIIEDTETNFYSNKGIVTTESTALNLRAYGSIYAEIIAEIPRNSTVTILDSTLLLSNCPDGKWYLVDYKGQVGYVSADYIQITEEKVKLTEKQLINIAQLRYYEGLNAKHWQMCSCFELEHNNTFNESEYRYILLKNIHSKDDWFEQVHTLLSKKYDDYYECDEIINNGDNYPVYLEKENNWYICDVVYRKGDIPVGLLSVDKHNIIEFEVESINENEVVFRGVINWDEVDYEYSEEQEIISEFSIVYEDGHWKCGKLPI